MPVVEHTAVIPFGQPDPVTGGFFVPPWFRSTQSYFPTAGEPLQDLTPFVADHVDYTDPDALSTPGTDDYVTVHTEDYHAAILAAGWPLAEELIVTANQDFAWSPPPDAFVMSLPRLVVTVMALGDTARFGYLMHDLVTGRTYGNNDAGNAYAAGPSWQRFTIPAALGDTVELAEIAAGQLRFTFWPFDGARLSFLAVEVDYLLITPTGVMPPCRVFPRDDGLGASAGPRVWPPPKSQQRSSRIGPGSYW